MRIRFSEWAESFLIAALIAAILFFICWPFRIDGKSMEDTLFPGDIALISRVMSFSTPVRGTVVVFSEPTRDQTKNLVKRIIGLPGETITLASSGVLIDGKPLPEPYAWGTITSETVYLLGDDEYFVIGDNRDESYDSRDFGPIKRSLIFGHVLAVILPPWHLKYI